MASSWPQGCSDRFNKGYDIQSRDVTSLGIFNRCDLQGSWQEEVLSRISAAASVLRVASFNPWRNRVPSVRELKKRGRKCHSWSPDLPGAISKTEAWAGCTMPSCVSKGGDRLLAEGTVWVKTSHPRDLRWMLVWPVLWRTITHRGRQRSGESTACWNLCPFSVCTHLSLGTQEDRERLNTRSHPTVASAVAMDALLPGWAPWNFAVSNDVTKLLGAYRALLGQCPGDSRWKQSLTEAMLPRKEGIKGRALWKTRIGTEPISKAEAGWRVYMGEGEVGPSWTVPLNTICPSFLFLYFDFWFTHMPTDIHKAWGWCFTA